MSTPCLWPLGPSSEGPQVNQVSWATRAHARGPAGSNRCPGRLRRVSEVLHVRPAVPGHSRLGPRASGVDPLSRVQRPSGLTSCPGQLALWSKGPGGRPVFPGDLCLCLSACEVDPTSLATQAWLQGPTVSTSCSWRHALVSECPRCRPALLGNSRSGPRAREFDLLFFTTQALIRGPEVSTDVPGDSGPSPRDRGVDQLSLATRGWFQVPARSTRSLWRLGPGSESPRGRPGLQGNSGPCPKPRGVSHIAWAIPARL